MLIALTILGAWLVVGVVLCFILGAAFGACEARGRRAMPQQLHATVHCLESLDHSAFADADVHVAA